MLLTLEQTFLHRRREQRRRHFGRYERKQALRLQVSYPGEWQTGKNGGQSPETVPFLRLIGIFPLVFSDCYTPL
jgi:hypothetical protein